MLGLALAFLVSIVEGAGEGMKFLSYRSFGGAAGIGGRDVDEPASSNRPCRRHCIAGASHIVGHQFRRVGLFEAQTGGEMPDSFYVCGRKRAQMLRVQTEQGKADIARHRRDRTELRSR